jgi:DNA-binding MarR family transcriptional regulator
VLNAFVDCTQANLTGLEVKVWLTLYRDTRNGTASTGQADIARRAGATLRGVQKALASLMKQGLVVLLVQGGLNRGRSRYRIFPLANSSS